MSGTNNPSGDAPSPAGDGAVFRRRDLEARIPRGVDNPFAIALERGELYVELYRPEGGDLQSPHERDECYFVVEGSGTFVLGDDRVPFEPGDCIFVPAGVIHRFEDFGDHLLTWVLFYGPRAAPGLTGDREPHGRRGGRANRRPLAKSRRAPR